jgi:hypothetical protein
VPRLLHRGRFSERCTLVVPQTLPAAPTRRVSAWAAAVALAALLSDRESRRHLAAAVNETSRPNPGEASRQRVTS